MITPCTDHLGNEYPSKTAMAEAYGLTRSCIKTRLKLNWSLQDALTTPSSPSNKKYVNKTYKDHLGNTYPSKVALAKAYGITSDVLNARLNSGMSLEESLTSKTNPYECKDHLGNIYPSQKARADAYGLTLSCINNRLRKNWSLKDALTTPVIKHKNPKRMKQCKDHLGNIYPSKTAMAKAYGITKDCIRVRMNMNWSLEKTLTTPLKPPGQNGAKQCKDHLGNVYSSKKERANAYHLTQNCIRERLRNGWSLEQALTTPKGKHINNTGGKLCKDHLENEYPSKTAMANAYELSRDCVKNRLRNGWSLEEALTTPKSDDYTKPEKCTDHIGNIFKSKSAMTRHYNIDDSTFNKRIANNWSLEDALTIPINKYMSSAYDINTCYDHLGNEFKSKQQRANAYHKTISEIESRLKLNWSLEDALTIPTRKIPNIGDEVIIPLQPGCKHTYEEIYIKVGEKHNFHYEPKAKIIYEKHFGPIADDEKVIFLDGNTTNFNIDNLYCIKRNMIQTLYQHHNYPNTSAEQTLTAIAAIQLLRTIKTKKKQIKAINEIKTQIKNIKEIYDRKDDNYGISKSGCNV